MVRRWQVYAMCLGSIMTFGGQVRAEEKIVVLDEIVVTATKTEAARKEVPNAMVVMEARDIEESVAKSVGELLANEPGIDWRTYGNYGGAAEEIEIRGMRAKGTQVLINGMAVNSPSFGSADVGQIPLNNIERIEVSKGSGSVLYGSGAIGGVVNIITKRPDHEAPVGAVTAGFGTENSYHVAAEQGMFVTDSLGYYLASNLRETDGFRDNSDLIHRDASLNLVLDRGKKLDASLYAGYIDREAGNPGVKPPPDTADYYLNGVKFYNDEAASLLNETGTEDFHTVLNVRSELTEGLAINLKSDYLNQETKDTTISYFSGDGFLTRVENQVFGNLLFLESKPHNTTTLLTGVDHRRYWWESNTNEINAADQIKPGTESQTTEKLSTTGPFVEAQIRPFSPLTAVLGLRHEHHSEFGSLNLPYYGLSYNPWPDTAIKFSHGRHFLAPTPNDLFWPEDAWGNKGNPDLQPETGWQSDATLEQALFSRKLFFTASLFQWDMKNKILWAPYDQWGMAWMPQNLKGYFADGLELGLKIGPFCQVRLGLSYTFLDAEEEAEEYSPENPGTKEWVTRTATYTPEHLFKATLTHENGQGLLTSITTRYTGKRYAYFNDESIFKTETYTLDDYWTIDLNVEQRLAENWLLAAQVNNLFYTGYNTYLESFYNPYTYAAIVCGYPGAGRSAGMSLTYEF